MYVWAPTKHKDVPLELLVNDSVCSEQLCFHVGLLSLETFISELKRKKSNYYYIIIIMTNTIKIEITVKCIIAY